MDEARAKEILNNCESHWDAPYYDLDHVLGNKCCLDGYFTADELEAIAWWMRNKG